MASFLNANLPSDDEEDEDFVPVDSDEERLKEEGASARRGAAGLDADAPPVESEHTRVARTARMDELWSSLLGGGSSGSGPPPSGGASRAGAKRLAAKQRGARGGATKKKPRRESWEIELGIGLERGAGGEGGKGAPKAGAKRACGAEAGKTTEKTVRGGKDATVAGGDATVGAGATPLESASADGATAASEGASADGTAVPSAAHVRRVAMPPVAPPSLPPPSAELAAAAAAALRAAEVASSSAAAQVAGAGLVTETRRFAGREVTITRAAGAGERGRGATGARAGVGAAAAGDGGPAGGAAVGSPGVVPGSVAGAALASAGAGTSGTLGAPTGGGLDAVLASLSGTKKVNVIDKSRSDWSELKSADGALEEELERHTKSSERFLDKQAFLKEAELKEYERTRDTRLNADMRTRGRL